MKKRWRNLYNNDYNYILALMGVSILGALIILYYLYFQVPVQADSDHWWSIAIGDWILNHAGLPTVDPFSWSVNNTGWITHQWFFCVLISLADSIWGDTGIKLMFLLSSIICLAAVVVILLQARGKTIQVTVCFLIFTFVVILFLNFRSYFFSLPLVIILFYLVYFERDSRYVFVIPLLVLIWTNLHSMAILFVCFLFMDAALEYLYTKKKKMLQVTGFSFLATLVNPYHIKIWHYVIKNFLEPGHREYISEWQPADFSSPILLILYVAIAFIIIHVLNKNKIKENHVSLSLSIVTVLGFIYSIYSFRAFLYFFILFLIFLSYFEFKKDARLSFNKSRFVLLSFFLMLAVSILGTLFMLQDSVGLDSDNKWPSAAVRFLKDNEICQDNLFHEYILGGYLMYHGIPTFIDARADLFFETGIFEDYIDIVGFRTEPGEIIAKYEIKNMLITKETPIYFYLKKDWNYLVVYEDDNFAIFSVSGTDFF